MECDAETFNMVSQQAVCHQCAENSVSIPGERDKCLCEMGYYMLSHRISDILHCHNQYDLLTVMYASGTMKKWWMQNIC